MKQFSDYFKEIRKGKQYQFDDHGIFKEQYRKE